MYWDPAQLISAVGKWRPVGIVSCCIDIVVLVFEKAVITGTVFKMEYVFIFTSFD